MIRKSYFLMQKDTIIDKIIIEWYQKLLVYLQALKIKLQELSNKSRDIIVRRLSFALYHFSIHAIKFLMKRLFVNPSCDKVTCIQENYKVLKIDFVNYYKNRLCYKRLLYKYFKICTFIKMNLESLKYKQARKDSILLLLKQRHYFTLNF